MKKYPKTMRFYSYFQYFDKRINVTLFTNYINNVKMKKGKIP